MNAAYQAAASRVLARSGPVADSDCIRVTGRLDAQGYARVRVRGLSIPQSAHRVVYTAVTGAPIPDGLTLDHLCHTRSDCAGGVLCVHRSCVNVDHLEAVSHEENSRRQWSARKQECASGHPYDEANTYVRPNGQRDCRACIRARARAYKIRSQARAAAVAA